MSTEEQFPILERYIAGRLGTNTNVIRSIRQAICVEGVDFVRHKKKLRHTEASVSKINAHLLQADPERGEKGPADSATPEVLQEAQDLIVAQKTGPAEAVAMVVKHRCMNPRLVICVLVGGDPKKPADWINVRVPHARTIVPRRPDGTPFLLPVRQSRGTAWDLIGPPPPRIGDWMGLEHDLIKNHQPKEKDHA